MRLFTGIDLPVAVAASLERLLEKLRPAARWRWSDPANLHITLKFIGEWPQQRLPELKTALQEMPQYAPISLHIRKLGFFPNSHSPRVFWAGIEAGPEMAALAGEIDGALARLGIQPEQRAYAPHLTLARIKTPAAMEPIREAIAGLPSLDFGSFAAERFYLYLSRPGPAGSVYTKLAEFPLGNS